MAEHAAEKDLRRVLGAPDPPTETELQVGEQPDANYPPAYSRTRAAVPIQQHAQMTKDLAVQLKHNEQLYTAWQDYALNFIVSQETPRARTAVNAAETLSSTFQCGIGVFNMGNLVRREYPYSVNLVVPHPRSRLDHGSRFS